MRVRERQSERECEKVGWTRNPLRASPKGVTPGHPSIFISTRSGIIALGACIGDAASTIRRHIKAGTKVRKSTLSLLRFLPTHQVPLFSRPALRPLSFLACPGRPLPRPGLSRPPRTGICSLGVVWIAWRVERELLEQQPDAKPGPNLHRPTTRRAPSATQNQGGFAAPRLA